MRGGSNSSDESFSVRKFDNSATYFKVRGDGKIGIGTTAPTRSLSISGTGSQYINVVSANDSGAGLLLGDTDAEIKRSDSVRQQRRNIAIKIRWKYNRRHHRFESERWG